MKYHIIDDLKRDVRIAMDENAIGGELLKDNDQDTLKLDEIIGSRIPIAARIVETIAPVQMLGHGDSFSTDSIAWENQPGYGFGSIILPDDFLRLLAFRMSDWDRAVSTTITDIDPQYQMQHSRFGGLRGNPQKPVVAIVNRAAGLSLEFFSCSAGAGVQVVQARYLPIPKIKDGMIEFPDKVRPAVVYYTGYLTAQILAQKDAANHLLQTALQLLQMQDNK